MQSATGVISFGSLQAAGYRSVSIDNQKYLVHRLVAAAFLDPPLDSSCWQVNHLDGDRGNNQVANLQYVTCSENQRHSFATNMSRNRKGVSKAVLWRRCGEMSWTRCASQLEAEQLLGVPRSSVSRCCRGSLTKTRGNGVWYEFKEIPHQDPELPARTGKASDEWWSAARHPCECDAIPNLMVSNHGRVSPVFPGKGYISRGTRMNDGYYSVTRRRRTLLVHRLVAATFIGRPISPDMEVNHKDSDRGNNHVDNLEYVTRSQNRQHAVLQRAKAGRIITCNGKAVQARAKGCEGPCLDFSSMKMAALYTHVPAKQISRSCKGLASGMSDGSHWEFRFALQETLPGEEWRPVVLEGVRACRH